MPRSPGSFSAALAPIVPFQLGASFVFAPGDRDLYVHLSETFGDNARSASWWRRWRPATGSDDQRPRRPRTQRSTLS